MAALDSEEFIAKLLGDDYVPLLDQMPDIRDFMKEMEIKEAEKLKFREENNIVHEEKKRRKSYMTEAEIIAGTRKTANKS